MAKLNVISWDGIGSRHPGARYGRLPIGVCPQQDFCSERAEGRKARKESLHNLALPWLGFAAFGGGTQIKDLQARLSLLASYHMWILEPWEAWMLQRISNFKC